MTTYVLEEIIQFKITYQVTWPLNSDYTCTCLTDAIRLLLEG